MESVVEVLDVLCEIRATILAMVGEAPVVERFEKWPVRRVDGAGAGHQRVDTYDLPAAFQQGATKISAHKPRTARDERPHVNPPENAKGL